MRIKKMLASAAITAVALSSFAVPAFASNAGDGSDYGTQPGYSVATGQTSCSGAGAFDFFGKDWNLGNLVSGHYVGGSYPGPGANGTQTGINNSTLCGNPHN